MVEAQWPIKTDNDTKESSYKEVNTEKESTTTLKDNFTSETGKIMSRMGSVNIFTKMEPGTAVSSRITWSMVMVVLISRTAATMRVIYFLCLLGYFYMNNRDKTGFYFDASTNKKYMLVY